MKRYFCTGSTGFIGREIVRQLLALEDTELVMCLTRGKNPNALEHERLQYWKGDICDVQFPQESFTDVIHGANEVNDLLQPDQMRYYYTIVEGTNRLLKWAWSMKVQRTLLLSSGAVARDTIYGRAKRQSEFLARLYRGNTKIARIFSVLGPEMPLNGQYAIGQFVGGALKGEVRYYGGESLRSYINVEDCARWLLHILSHANGLRPVDVAGESTFRIEDVAKIVAQTFGVKCSKFDGPDRSDAYLPDLTEARKLGLEQTKTLGQSLNAIRDHYKAVSHVCGANLEQGT